MNKIHKVIFCKATQTWVAVSEIAKTGGKNKLRVRLTAGLNARFSLKALTAAVLLALSGQVLAAGPCKSDGSNLSCGTASVEPSYPGGPTGAPGIGGSVALGAGAKVHSSSSVALGLRAQVGDNTSTAPNTHLGNDNNHNNSVAIGLFSKVTGWNSTASGSYSNVTKHSGSAYGTNSQVDAINGSAFGTSAKVGTEAKGGIAVGFSAQSVGAQSIAIGSADESTSAVVDVGVGNNIVGTTNVTKASGAKAVAIGAGAQTTQEKAVALGASSKATRVVGSNYAGYDPTTGIQSTDTSSTWLANLAAVSVGDSTTNKTRQIINLAAGSADTDAVNVAQLKALRSFTAQGQTHYYSVNDGPARVYNDPDDTSNYTNDGAQGAHALAAGVGSFAGADGSIAIGSVFYQVKENATEQADYANATAPVKTLPDGRRYRMVSGMRVYQYADKDYVYRQTSVSKKATDSIAIGKGSQVTGDAANSIAIGSELEVTSPNSIVLGSKAVGNSQAVVIGVEAKTGATGANVIGYGADSATSFSNAIGYQAKVLSDGANGGNDANAIGHNAQTKGTAANAIGSSAWAYGNQSVAISNSAKAYGRSSIALGRDSTAGKDTLGHTGGDKDEFEAIAIGALAQATEKESIAFGYQAIASGKNTVSTGTVSKAYQSGSIAIGNRAVAGLETSTTDSEAIAIGDEAKALKAGSIALGKSAETNQTHSIAIGDGAKARGEFTDTKTGVTVGNSIAIGRGSQTFGTAAAYAVALGDGATVGQKGALALGSQSYSYTDIGRAGYDPLGATSAADMKTATWKSTHGAVSVGDDGKRTKKAVVTRQIMNVAAGTDPTDAVNVAQLKAAQTHYYSVNPTNSFRAYNNATDTSNYTNDGALGANSLAAGKEAKAYSSGSVAVGFGAQTGDLDPDTGSPLTDDNGNQAEYNNTAIGTNSKATGTNSSAFGSSAIASGTNSVAFGNAATATGAEDMLKKSLAGYSTAIGGVSQATGQYGTAIGYHADATAGYATALGVNAQALGGNSIAIGSAAVRKTKDADGKDKFVNDSALASGSGSIAIGRLSDATAEHTTAVGLGAQATANWASAFGRNAKASGGSATAVGDASQATAKNATALGTGAEATTLSSIAIGDGARAYGTKTVNKVTTGDSIAIGKGSTINGTAPSGVAIGSGSRATKENAIALGSNSRADRAYDKLGYDPLGTLSAAEKKSATWTSTHGAVSVGNSTTKDKDGNPAPITRQIINLAAGSADTDAVNVAQLKAAQTHYYSVKSSIIDKGSNYLNDGAKSTNALAAGVGTKASNHSATALGTLTVAKGERSTAVGAGSHASEKQGVALGARSIASGDQSMAIGNDTFAVGSGSIALGVDDTGEGKASDNQLYGKNRAGSEGVVDYNTTRNRWGNGAYRKTMSVGLASSAIGAHAQSLSQGSVAIGVGATAGKLDNPKTGDLERYFKQQRGHYQKQVKKNHQTWDDAAIELEATRLARLDVLNRIKFRELAEKATGKHATAIGAIATAQGEESTAIGAGAKATTDDGVAFGSYALADRVASTAATRAKFGGYNPITQTVDGTNTDIEATRSNLAAISVGNVKHKADGTVDTEAKTNKLRQITAVAAGTNDADAVNVAQLRAASQPWKLTGNLADGKTPQTNNINPNDEVQFIDGTHTQAVITAEDKGVTTVKYNVVANGELIVSTTGTTAGKVKDPGNGGSLVTATTVANAINKSGFKLAIDGNMGTDNVTTDDKGFELIKPSDTVTIKGGNHITVSQDKGKITIATNNQSIAESAQLPVVYTTADGTRVYKRGDKFYNSLTGGTEVTDPIIASMNSGGDSTTTPTTLTNVASNFDGAKTGTTAPTTSASKPTGADALVEDNAATVGDVLNAGWNLQGNGTAVDFVTAYDTVNFKDGSGTTAKVTKNTTAGANEITFNINTDGKTTKIDGTGGNNRVVVATGKIDVTDGKASGNITNGTIATVGDVATAINSVYWTVGNNKNTEVSQISASDRVNFVNGNATSSSVTETVSGTTEVKYDVNVDGSTIKVSNGQLVADGAGIAGATSLTYKANKGTKQKVTLAKGLDFTNTTNIIASVGAEGVVKHTLNDNITVTSVKAGDTTINNDGLTITGGPSVTKTGIDANNTKITNVKAGTTEKDAVNVSQLTDITKIIGGDQTKIDATSGEVTFGDTANKGVGDTGATNIHDAIKSIKTSADTANAGFTIAGAAPTTTATDATIKPTDTLKIVGSDDNKDFDESDGGKNIYTVVNADNTVRIGLAKKLDVTSVKAGTINATNSITIGDTAGNNTVLTSTAKGLDVGGDKITNVGAGTGANDVVNVSQLADINTIIGGDQTKVDKTTGKVTFGDTANKGVGDTGETTIHDAIKSIKASADTANEGFTIAGAAPTTAADATIKPTDTLKIVGATANTDFNKSDAGANIYTVVDANDTVRIGLAKDLAIDSVQAKTMNATNSITIGDTAGNNTVLTSTAKGLDVGGDNITNVGAGTGANDVVNVSQLADINTIIGGDQTKVDKTTGKVTFGDTANKGVGDTGQTNIHDAIKAVNVEAGKRNTVSAGENIVVSPTTANGQTNYQVATAKNVNFDSVTVGGVAINRDSGIDAGNKKVQNVAPGKVSPTSTDAITGGQLYHSMQGMSNNLNNHVANLYEAIGDTHDSANAGAASAMAAASLPQPHDPGANMVSAAVGTYNGQSALSVGVSAISDNGKWIIKGALTHDTQSNTGASVGVGYQW